MRAQEFINEISDEQLQRYLDRAGRQVDARQERMARVRDRLNKGYEIYHAETPNKIVDRFEANTPQEAKRYYDDFITKYESDVDYDLRLRRATGIMEDTEDYAGMQLRLSKDANGVAVRALAGDKELGMAEFFFDEQGQLDPQTVWVDERYHGQGIAASMYDYLKDKGYTIVRSWDQTDAGRGFWDKHRGKEATVWENFADGIRAYHGNQGGIDTEQLHAPMWFTASRPDAEYYAGNDGYVVVVDLDIQNPYVLQPGEEANSVLRRWQELQAQGYDGIYDRRLGDWIPFSRKQIRVISKDDTFIGENFADGKVKGKSRPGRVKRAGASCAGSVTDLRQRAKNSSGEKAKMYHWCANMKSGKKKNK